MMSILLIRPGALGDTLLTIPLVRSLQIHHPDASVTWLGTGRYRDVVPPDITFAALDSRSWTWLFETGARIPKNVPHFDHGYAVLNRWRELGERLLQAGAHAVTGLTSVPPPETHLVEHLHRGLGLPLPERLPACAPLAPQRQEDFVWLHPGSGGPRKCVPLKVFRELIRAVNAEHARSVVVTLGEEDAFLLRDPDWEPLVSHPSVTVVEGASLGILCSRLGGALLYMGNDSGISHLAANLGIPSLVFFRSTDPQQWAPWVPDGGCAVVDVREAGHGVGGMVDLGHEMLNRLISC